MVWTGEVTKKEIVKDCLTVTVRYSDGTRSFDETYKDYSCADPEWIKKTVKQKIAHLESIDSGIDAIDLGPVPEPSPVVVDEEFNRALRKLNLITQLVSLGALTKNDQKVVDYVLSLREKVLANWDKI